MEWTAYRMSIVWFIHSELEQARVRGQVALHAMASRGDVKKVNAFIKGEED